VKRRLTIIALTTLAVVALISAISTVTTPAHADGGATQISGIADFADVGIDPCDDPEGASADLALNMAGEDGTGDLNGCLYSFIDFDNTQCINTGNGQSIYHERGTEIFVGEYDGKEGTFETTYLFTSKWSKPCEVEGVGGYPPLDAEEIFGRCQHPIIEGSGTKDFTGVTGRFDIRDIIDKDTGDITLDYRGHLRW